MKSVIVNLTLLSLLVVTDAWFLNLGKSKSTESVKAATAQGARKVILVAKKVYVPMYADEDTVSSVADRLLPISSAVLTASEADGRQQQQQQQQQQMVPYPPPASYAMYAPATSAPVVADSAVPQYAIYPAVAEPQYVQFGVGPSQALMYLNGDGSVAAAPYYPTEIGQATATAEESAVPSEVTNA